MSSKTRRSLRPFVVTAALVLAACGGSDDSSTDATTPANDPVETESIETDSTETEPVEDEAEGTDSAESTGDTDAGDTSGDDEQLIPLDQVDDSPECQALAIVGSSIAEVLIVVAFASFDEELDPVELVPFELVAFAGLDDQVAVLRDGFPEGLFDTLEPLLVRIEGVPGVLDAAGLTDDDLAALEASIENDSLPESGELFDKLQVAGELFVAEFGPLDDVAEAMEEVDPVDEEASQAALAEQCPVFASLEDS